MRKSNTQDIKEVITEYLKGLNIDQKIKEISVTRLWPEIMGKTIGKATKDIYIKDKKLIVELHSSVVRHELMMLKSGIIKAINDRVGENVINDLILR